MRVGIDSLLSSTEFSTDLKRIQTPHSYSGISEQIKPLQAVGQATEFKFESKFKPLQVIWQSFQGAILEDNQRL